MAIDSQRKLHQWLDSAWCSHPVALHVIDEAAATPRSYRPSLPPCATRLQPNNQPAATTLERRHQHHGPGASCTPCRPPAALADQAATLVNQPAIPSHQPVAPPRLHTSPSHLAFTPRLHTLPGHRHDRRTRLGRPRLEPLRAVRRRRRRLHRRGRAGPPNPSRTRTRTRTLTPTLTLLSP